MSSKRYFKSLRGYNSSFLSLKLYPTTLDVILLGIGKKGDFVPLHIIYVHSRYPKGTGRCKWIVEELRDLWRICIGDISLEDKYGVRMKYNLIKAVIEYKDIYDTYYRVILYFYCDVPQDILNRVFSMPEDGFSIEPRDFIHRATFSDTGRFPSPGMRVFPYLDFLVCCDYCPEDWVFEAPIIPENTELGRFLSSGYVLLMPNVEHILKHNFLNIKVFSGR